LPKRTAGETFPKIRLKKKENEDAVAVAFIS
jgi:hypothetical protein